MLNTYFALEKHLHDAHVLFPPSVLMGVSNWTKLEQSTILKVLLTLQFYQ